MSEWLAAEWPWLVATGVALVHGFLMGFLFQSRMHLNDLRENGAWIQRNTDGWCEVVGSLADRLSEDEPVADDKPA